MILLCGINRGHQVVFIQLTDEVVSRIQGLIHKLVPKQGWFQGWGSAGFISQAPICWLSKMMVSGLVSILHNSSGFLKCLKGFRRKLQGMIEL